jgi:glycosyltransferase involved in cell wall biosynthesis
MKPPPWKILWVKAGALHPPDTGGKIRTLSMLRELNRWNEVTYLGLRPADVELHPEEEPDAYAAEKLWITKPESARKSVRFFFQLALNLLSSNPFALSKHYSPDLRAKLIELDASGRFDLIVCDFLAPALHFEGHTWRTPTVLFQHNMESQIWKRMAANHSRWIGRAYLRDQFRRMWRSERQLSRIFDGIITVSKEDSRFAREEYGLTRVLGDVPPGVDTEFFKPATSKASPFPVLAFLGSMDWLPNIEGVRWFVDEVYPLVKLSVPDVRLRIIGRRPGPEIQEMSRIDPSIEVTGTVEDVRPWLRDAAAMIVPLLSGGGTRIKILEAMAAGTPVLSTTVGAEGLPFTDGTHLLLADVAEVFAERSVDLIRSFEMRQNLANRARSVVVDHYSWAAASRTFQSLCSNLREKQLA